jgi:hypothetical protein
MTPIKKDLEIWQGKTYDEPWIFGRAIKDETGQVVDTEVTNLGGYTGKMQLRESVDSEEPTLELTTENGRILIDAEHGEVRLFLTAEETAALPVGSYKYDLELITASGRVYGPLYGKVKVRAEVTRDA